MDDVSGFFLKPPDARKGRRRGRDRQVTGYDTRGDSVCFSPLAQSPGPRPHNELAGAALDRVRTPTLLIGADYGGRH